MNPILQLIWVHVFLLIGLSIGNASRGELGWYLFDWAFILTGVGVVAAAQMAQEAREGRKR